MAIVVVVYATAGDDSVSDAERREAIAVVESEWDECLDLAGVTTDGATVELADSGDTDRPVEVELENGATFIVELDGALGGAAVGNDIAASTLDEASSLGGDCG